MLRAVQKAVIAFEELGHTPVTPGNYVTPQIYVCSTCGLSVPQVLAGQIADNKGHPAPVLAPFAVQDKKGQHCVSKPAYINGP